MNTVLRRWFASQLLVCTCLLPSTAGTLKPPKLKPGQGFVEGYVRDEGDPVRNLELMIMGPPYEQRNDWMVPIISPRVVGVIGSNAPPSLERLYGMAQTDKTGHYVATLPEGEFLLYTARLPHKQKPPTVARLVRIRAGTGATQDFDLGSGWSTAESAIEQFRDGIAAIFSAAREQRPFRSLVVDYLPTILVTRVTLPGAHQCGIVTVNLNKDDDWGLPFYDCRVHYKSHERASADYELLIKLVESVTSLTATQSSARETRFAGNALIPADTFSVGISKDDTVSLNYSTVGRFTDKDKKP